MDPTNSLNPKFFWPLNFWDPWFFWNQKFFLQNFLAPKFFRPNIFWTKNYYDLKFLGPKIFRQRFLKSFDPNFLDPHFFYIALCTLHYVHCTMHITLCTLHYTLGRCEKFIFSRKILLWGFGLLGIWNKVDIFFWFWNFLDQPQICWKFQDPLIRVKKKFSDYRTHYSKRPIWAHGFNAKIGFEKYASYPEILVKMCQKDLQWLFDQWSIYSWILRQPCLMLSLMEFAIFGLYLYQGTRARH